MCATPWPTGGRSNNWERPHSSLGYQTPEQFRQSAGHANVEGQGRLPHLHSHDGGYGVFPEAKPKPRISSYDWLRKAGQVRYMRIGVTKLAARSLEQPSTLAAEGAQFYEGAQGLFLGHHEHLRTIPIKISIFRHFAGRAPVLIAEGAHTLYLSISGNREYLRARSKATSLSSWACGSGPAARFWRGRAWPC